MIEPEKYPKIPKNLLARFARRLGGSPGSETRFVLKKIQGYFVHAALAGSDLGAFKYN